MPNFEPTSELVLRIQHFRKACQKFKILAKIYNKLRFFTSPADKQKGISTRSTWYQFYDMVKVTEPRPLSTGVYCKISLTKCGYKLMEFIYNRYATALDITSFKSINL